MENLNLSDFQSNGYNPSVYVGTYRKYNEGSLYGMWVDLVACGNYDTAGYLKSRGFDVAQRDLSIKVARDVLLEYGDETTGETNACSRILSGEARVSITNYLDEISHTR